VKYVQICNAVDITTNVSVAGAGHGSLAKVFVRRVIVGRIRASLNSMGPVMREQLLMLGNSEKQAHKSRARRWQGASIAGSSHVQDLLVA